MWSRLLNRFREKVVTYWFEREFRIFKYPFESIDYLIGKLSKQEQSEYYADVRRFVKSKAYEMEMMELKKMFYKELSLSTQNEIQRSAYRLCLLFIRKIERRYKYLTDQSYLEDKINRVSRKI